MAAIFAVALPWLVRAAVPVVVGSLVKQQGGRAASGSHGMPLGGGGGGGGGHREFHHMPHFHDDR